MSTGIHNYKHSALANASVNLHNSKVGGVIVPVAPPAEWVRPSEWLALPELVDGDQKVVMLVDVFDHGSNFIAFKFTGDYTVDWGDGTALEKVASGVVAERNVDFDIVPGGNVIAPGRKQVLVTVTPQAGQNLTTGNIGEKHSLVAHAYGNPIVDVAVVGSFFTSLKCYGTINLPYLEQFKFYGQCNIATMQQMFIYCYSLQSVPLFDTSSVTTMQQMFYACYSLQSVPLFDTSSVTTMQQMFYACYSLQSVPLFDTSSVTTMQQMFIYCYSLQSVPLFDTSSVTTMQQMFYACYSLNSVPLFDTSSVTTMQQMFIYCYSLQSVPLFDTSSVTTMQQMFYACYSLSNVEIINIGVDVAFTDCKLNVEKLNLILNNLATVAGKTITLTGNWGVDDVAFDPTIATDKGWTVIVAI